MTGFASRAGLLIAGALLSAAVLAPFLAANRPDQQFPDHTYAPPMWPHLRDEQGRWHKPFIYPVKLVNRLELGFEEDRGRRLPLQWFARGRLVSIDPTEGAWLPLGGDALGRDVYSRLVYGARLSLGISIIATAAALILGSVVGAFAGFFGGRTETVLMATADFFIVLPVIYVVLALRAAMPLVLTTSAIFWATTVILAVVGWPFAARAVRAVVAVEKNREYAESARAAGASGSRILLRHLVPAARGVLAVQASLLVPAFIMAEATLSFVGLGFVEPSVSWGGMLRDAGRGRAFTDAPWLLAPALAIGLSMLSVQLVGGTPTVPASQRSK